MTAIPTIVLGPSDHGRRMSLDEFDTAEGREGYIYELSRGEVIVTDVPNPPHNDIVHEVRRQLFRYDEAHRGVIHGVYGSLECKLLVGPTQSERHPDAALYKTPPPRRDSSVWSVWVPEIVIEVVSPDSAHRDYVEKAQDYLIFGVKEYWIIDAPRGVITVHSRSRGQWETRELRAADRYTTPLLPAFELVASPLLAMV